MSRNSVDFYNRFAIIYPVIDIFLRPQKKKLLKIINQLPHGHLLEIGVGNGSHLKYYERHEVTGVDTSAKMLALAQRHQRGHITLLQMNGEALQLPEKTFDYVVLSHVITVVNDPVQLMKEVHRVLKPGGKVLILNHFTPDNWLRYVDHLFDRFAHLFHFKSVFTVKQWSQLHQLRLLHATSTGLFAYFKILTYEKNL